MDESWGFRGLARSEDPLALWLARSGDIYVTPRPQCLDMLIVICQCFFQIIDLIQKIINLNNEPR